MHHLKRRMTVLNLIAAIAISLCFTTAAALADSGEELKRAEADMKTSAIGVQKGISDALMLIREITPENAESRNSEVLKAIQIIENNALNAIDQLALTGPFMNALNDVRVEIRQTLKTVEKMPPSMNRDSNLETLKSQFERFNELQTSISEQEGAITLLLGQFSGLKRDIELSIRIGKIGELITSLESVQANLDDMSRTLGVVLQYEVGEVQLGVTN